jgi:hypothetical protein
MAAPSTCPKCGASLPQQQIPGEVFQCNNCGVKVRFKTQPVPDKAPAPPPAKPSAPLQAVPISRDDQSPHPTAEGSLQSDQPKSKRRQQPEHGGDRDPSPRKKKRKKVQGSKAVRLLLIAGGVAGLMMMLCGGGVGFWLLSTRPADSKKTGGAEEHKFEAAVASNVPKDPKAQPAGAVFPFGPAPAADGPLPAPSDKWPKWNRPVAPKWPVEEFIDGDGVPVPLGPAPQRPTFAADLLILVGRMAIAEGTRIGPLFSPDCRFALASSQLGPVCVQKFVDDPDVPGRRCFTAVDPNKPQPPHTLHDLTTGKRCGEYPGTMQLSLDGRLSPDGQYCVTRAWEKMPDLTKAASFWLDVWKQGEPKVTGQIAPTGNVRWAEFISPTHFAVFQQEPDPALVVWDVVARKVETRIPAKIAPKVDPKATQSGAYLPNPLGGAVAPGGRFVAIGGSTEVTVFDLKEAKEHGKFPMRGNAGIGFFEGCEFLTEPNRLVVQVGVHLSAWELATGKLTHATPLELRGGGFKARMGNGPAGQLQYATHRLTQFGQETSPLVPPTTDPAPFVCQPYQRSILPQEVSKRLTYEQREFDIIFTWKLDDKVTKRADVPVHEPFEVPAPRPAVAMGNRAAVTTLQATPPATWQALPASEWTKPDAGGSLPEWPAAISGSQAAVVRYVQIEKRVRPYGKKQRYFQMVWDRYDLATGKRLGTPVPLWPWANDPKLLSEAVEANIPTPPSTTIAALSADGETLAVVDPNEPHRIDLWNTKGERTGYYAAAEGTIVQWLGWSPGGKLLTLAGGSLTAWDARAAKALWEVSGGYGPPSELARGSRWGAFHAGSHVDLIDTATGKCLGRCRVQQSIADPVALAISPDAKRLMVVTKKSQFTRSLDGSYEFYSGTLWDLTTGTAESFPFGTVQVNQFNDLHHAGWITPDHFAGFFLGLDLYDVRAKAMVAQYGVSGQAYFVSKKPWFRTSPDGRMWVHYKAKTKADDIRGPDGPIKKKADDTPAPSAWIPFTLPAESAPLFDPGRTYVEFNKQPLRIEVDLQESQRSKRGAQAIADVLAKRGYTIGDSDWKIRVAFELSPKHSTLTHPNGGETKIYGALLKWTLVPPSGGEPVWKWDHEKSMLTGSKFAKGMKVSREGLPLGQSVYITEFDFEGRDPMKALTEEYLDRTASAPEVPGNLARWAVVAAGKGLPLPLTGNCRLAGE